VSPEDIRIRTHPVLSSPQVPRDRWQRLAGTDLSLPASAAAAPGPAASARLGELIPLLARLLEDVLRAPATPLTLRIDAPAAARPSRPPDPQQLALALATAIADSGESGRAVQDRSLPGQVRMPPESPSAAPLPEARASAPPDVLPRQLSWFATGELAFQFAPWPGQDVVLVISRRPGQSADPAPPDKTLLARLDLELPALGPVQAILRYDDRGLDVALRTDAPAAAETLQAGRVSLALSLDGAGLQVNRIAVSHGLGQ